MRHSNTPANPEPEFCRDSMPRCRCGSALGWTRYIRGHSDCEVCALDTARRRAGIEGSVRRFSMTVGWY